MAVRVYFRIERHNRLFRRWKWNIDAAGFGRTSDTWVATWTRGQAMRQAIGVSTVVRNQATALAALQQVPTDG